MPTIPIESSTPNGRINVRTRTALKRFQLATGKQDNSSRLGQVRREIARVATLLREREIEAAEAAATEVRA